MPFYVDAIQLDGATADPASPQDGERWYRADTQQHKKMRNSVVEVDVAIPESLAPANAQYPAWEAAGSRWVPTTLSATVTLGNNSATASTSTTTSSVTDVAVGSMTLTPGAGTYLVMFATALSHSNTGTTSYVSVYANGVKAAASENRFVLAGAQQANMAVASCTLPVVITVAAGQAIDVRWRTSGGTLTAYNRTITLIKIG